MQKGRDISTKSAKRGAQNIILIVSPFERLPLWNNSMQDSIANLDNSMNKHNKLHNVRNTATLVMLSSHSLTALVASTFTFAVVGM